MNKFIEPNKMSKKAQKAYYAERRNFNGFNTGTRDMKTEKLPTRAMNKRKLQKEMQEWD